MSLEEMRQEGRLLFGIATLLEGQVDSWCRHLNNHPLRVMPRPSREASIAAWLSRCWPCSVSI